MKKLCVCVWVDTAQQSYLLSIKLQELNWIEIQWMPKNYQKTLQLFDTPFNPNRQGPGSFSR